MLQVTLHLHGSMLSSNRTHIGIIKLTVEASDTVGKMKTQIFDKTGFPPGQQRLTMRGLLAGKQMIDTFILSAYNMQYESTLHIDLTIES